MGPPRKSGNFGILGIWRMVIVSWDNIVNLGEQKNPCEFQKEDFIHLRTLER